jgi:hypothetical protein
MPKKKTPMKTARMKSSGADTSPKLLSGGNPQIAKGDGDAPVQAYIAAMPDWKQGVGRTLDTWIVDTVPEIRKAVRWNTVFYGITDQGWCICYHCFTRYVKLSFLNGGSLDPLPPEGSKYPAVRSLHIHENETLDESLIRVWVRQSAELPGDPLF